MTFEVRRQEPRKIAALFVEEAGVYSGLEEVDLWGISRDARTYSGPWPVVAHPPCERWGRFWSADGSTAPGQDKGCFASALHSVRTFSGVLEHPEASHAFRAHGLPKPRRGAWTKSDCGGYVTEVAQRNYGHRARKMTWLFYSGVSDPPDLDWSDPGAGGVYLAQPGRCSRAKRRRTCPCRICEGLFGEDWAGAHNRGVERMTPKENNATPIDFRDLLLQIAQKAIQ